MYANRPTMHRVRAQTNGAMASLFYIPANATLLLLFKAARGRLIATSENLGSLSDARLALATEEMNRISDDIRQAKGASYSDEYDAVHSAGGPAGPDSPESRHVAIDAPVSLATPRTPHKELKIDTLARVDFSAEPDGVQWAGEYNLLAARREKAAFVSLLVRLGYSPEEFRVTVRRAPSSGPRDKRPGYSVLVAQSQNGVADREKRYAGGQDAEWVNDFGRDAATDFPCDMPFQPASDRRLSH
jgi:hypothetical protein